MRLSNAPGAAYNPSVANRILRRALWVVAFGVLWLPVLDDPPLFSGAYLQNVTTDGATVAMITGSPTRLALEVRDGTGGLVGAASDAADVRRHGLRVEGLRPGEQYSYVLTEDGTELAAGEFHTAPASDAAPVRFAFVGDSGGQPWWVWLQTAPILHLPARWHWLPPAGTVAAVGAAIADYGPDFVLHLGDIVYPWGRHAQYSSGFFRPFGAAIARAPFYPVLGNHDVMDTGGLQTLSNFHLPDNPVTGDSRCYSFAFGSVRVIALDCTAMFDAVNGHVEPGHPSYEFLAAELATRSEPWIVVASHYPMRSASRQRDRADLLQHLRPLLESYGATVYLSGHDHCYQRFGSVPGSEKDRMPLIVSGAVPVFAIM